MHAMELHSHHHVLHPKYNTHKSILFGINYEQRPLIWLYSCILYSRQVSQPADIVCSTRACFQVFIYMKLICDKDFYFFGESRSKTTFCLSLSKYTIYVLPYSEWENCNIIWTWNVWERVNYKQFVIIFISTGTLDHDMVLIGRCQ